MPQHIPNFMKSAIALLMLLLSLTSTAQETIKTMFYNVLDFPEAFPSNREVILKNILDVYQPDIFMVCELQNEEGADVILDASLNDEGVFYERAPFIANQSGSSELQQMIYFRSSLFSLENNQVIQTSVRDINRYTLRLLTQDTQTEPVIMEIFVSHLKSSQGGANVNLRFEMVQEFVEVLETLDPSSFVIFAGDLNLYTSTEPAYQELLDGTNTIPLRDPIDTPGAWNNNMNFQDIHTQSTRTSSGPFGAGAGGGMDDRFDFILISENMVTNPTLQYVENSYRAFGNNGNCFNKSVNDPSCTGPFSEVLRNDLYAMSDHLPVVMELQTNRDISLSGTNFEVPSQPLQLESTMVSHTLTLSISPSAPLPMNAAIYNVLGQRIMDIDVLTGSKHTIPVSALADGLYYIITSVPQAKPLKFLKRS
jgi:hypothetical protein